MAYVDSLTPRERKVWALLAQGLMNQEIADVLGLAVHTIETYLRSLYPKLGVVNRTQAAVAFLTNGESGNWKTLGIREDTRSGKEVE